MTHRMGAILHKIERLEKIDPDNEQHDAVIEAEINRLWQEWSNLHNLLLNPPKRSWWNRFTRSHS